MTRHTVVPGARRSAAVFAVLLAAACGKNDQAKAKETTGAAPAGGASSAPSLPGTLVKAIDQYSADELFDLTRRLQFAGGVDSARRCRGQGACRGTSPSASTRLRVDAVVGQDSLNPGAVPANGVVAARVLNRGQFADTMYNTAPGAEHENYLIVQPVAGSATATWRLEELTTTTGRRAHRTIASGIFRGCNHPFAAGARADFKTCAQAATVRPASFGRVLQAIESPIWIGCIAGCCTADPPDGRT